MISKEEQRIRARLRYHHERTKELLSKGYTAKAASNTAYKEVIAMDNRTLMKTVSAMTI